VDFLVSFEVRNLGESFGASFKCTFVWSFSGMDSEMFVKGVELLEFFTATFLWTFIIHFHSELLFSELKFSLFFDGGFKFVIVE